MKKIFILFALALFTLAVQAQTAQDFTGKFLLTQMEVVSDPNNDLKADYLGSMLTVSLNSYPQGDVPELNMDNLFPTNIYKTAYSMLDIDQKKAIVVSKRSAFYISGYKISTYADDAADRDQEQSDWGAYGKGTPDNIADLVVTFSDDLETITVEKAVFVSPSTGAEGLKIEKMVYERAKIPASPTISANFNLETGFNDVNIELPATLENGSTPLASIDKVVLERDQNWNGYEQIYVWENPTPGSLLKFEDQDLDFDNPNYQYRATVYIGFNSSYDYVYCTAGMNAPQVKNLTATTTQGKAPVVLSFTLPSAEELKMPLDKVVIQRGPNEYWGMDEIAVITEGLDADAVITYTDNDLADGKNYNYIVKTYWKYGSSWESQVNVFVGTDKPGRVQNVKASYAGGKVTLTWDAPEAGRNGGFFDPETVRYAVTRSVGNGWNEEEITPEEGIAETTFVDEFASAEPVKVYYYVYCSDDFATDEEAGWYSAGTDLYVGEAYTLPFVETFDKPGNWDGYFATDNLWDGDFDLWGNVSYGFEFNINEETLGSGFYSFNKGASSWYFPGTDEFTSLDINFSGTSCPVTLLTMVATPDDCTATVEVKSGETSFGKVSPFNIETNEYWESRVYAVPMPELAGKEAAKVTFAFDSGDVRHDHNIIIIDEIRIMDFPTAENLKIARTGNGYKLTWDEPREIDESIWDEIEVYRATVVGDEEPQFEMIANGIVDTEYEDNIMFETPCTVYYMVKTVYSDPYKVKTPSATVSIDNITTSINSAAATTGTKYYNTQGMRVARPAKGNVYIKVVDGKASKVVF